MVCSVVFGIALAPLGCLDEPVMAPQQVAVTKDGQGHLAAAQFGPDSVQAVNYCGGKILIRSAHDTAYTIKWVAQNSTPMKDSGVVTLPGREAGSLYSGTLVVPDLSGFFTLTMRQVSGAAIDAPSASSSSVSCPSVPITVPSGTPSTTQAAIYSPGNLIGHPEGFPGTLSRNTLLVRFSPTSTPAARGAALDSIHAEIIGGIPVGRGFFHVRFPLNGDSSSAAPVRRAYRKLRGMPQVVDVEYDWTSLGARPTYIRPADGPGFLSWQLKASQADGANWGLEAISAPLAWGCTVGDSLVKVAVFDRGNYAHADLTLSLGVREYSSDGTPLHGTAIAGIVAANSNDTTGITGVLWSANVDLFEHRGDAADSLIPAAWRPYARMQRTTLDTRSIVA